MKKKKTLIIIGIIVVMAASAVVLYVNSRVTNTKPPVVTAPQTASVAITEDGISPGTLKIKEGTVVIWTSVDVGQHRIAADPYPTHTSYPELDSKTTFGNNGTYRFTFNTAGTYHYHDEQNPQRTGVIIVEK